MFVEKLETHTTFTILSNLCILILTEEEFRNVFVTFFNSKTFFLSCNLVTFKYFWFWAFLLSLKISFEFSARCYYILRNIGLKVRFKSDITTVSWLVLVPFGCTSGFQSTYSYVSQRKSLIQLFTLHLHLKSWVKGPPYTKMASTCSFSQNTQLSSKASINHQFFYCHELLNSFYQHGTMYVYC